MNMLFVEAYPLEREPTGVGRYLGNVLLAWTMTSPFPLENVILIGHGEPAPQWKQLQDSFSWITLAPNQNKFFLWQQIHESRWLKKQKEGVFWGCNYSIPMGLRIPATVVIHDVSFFRHPEWFDWKMRWFKSFFIRKSVHSSQHIFVPSQFTKTELLSLFPGLPEDKITITYEGWDPSFTHPPRIDKKTLFQQFNLPEDAFIFLHVGSIFQRRRMDLILLALRDVLSQTKNTYLVVIGKNMSVPYIDYKKMALELGIQDHIRWLSYQPEHIVHAFYHFSGAVLYISEYEGFGLPVLEALSLHKRVIASQIPVFEELYSGYVLLTTFQKEELVRSMIECVKGTWTPPSPEPLLKTYSWELAAQRISTLLKNFL